MLELRAFLAEVEDDGHSWTDRLTVTTKAGTLLPLEVAADSVVFEEGPGLIALIRPLDDGREADPALRSRLEDERTA